MSPVDMKAQYVAEPLGGELAVKIGKPAAEWTEDDIVGLVAQGGIRVVSLMHVDGEGELRALDFLPRSEAHLREILRAGERADGASSAARRTVGEDDPPPRATPCRWPDRPPCCPMPPSWPSGPRAACSSR